MYKVELITLKAEAKLIKKEITRLNELKKFKNNKRNNLYTVKSNKELKEIDTNIIKITNIRYIITKWIRNFNKLDPEKFDNYKATCEIIFKELQTSNIELPTFINKYFILSKKEKELDYETNPLSKYDYNSFNTVYKKFLEYNNSFENAIKNKDFMTKYLKKYIKIKNDELINLFVEKKKIMRELQNNRKKLAITKKLDIDIVYINNEINILETELSQKIRNYNTLYNKEKRLCK